jgi:fibro-slime domain-containing protein
MLLALYREMAVSMSWLKITTAALALFFLGSSGCAVDTSSSKLGSVGSGGSGPASSATGMTATVGGVGGSDFSTSATGAGGTDECDNTLDVTYRDFSQSHPDFEMSYLGDQVRRQLVKPLLGEDKRPVFLDGIGCPADPNNQFGCANWKATEPVIQSAASFQQWFHTIDGVNFGFDKTITLTEEPPGSGVYVYDNSGFFPLGPSEGFGVSPVNNNPEGKNYLFTTEIHLNFTYEAQQVFNFRGDDDLWIFVNNRLALDLGSLHAPAEGTIDFDALAGALDISPGGVYAMDIFHAERHTTGSNFRIETNISCFTPGEAPK